MMEATQDRLCHDPCVTRETTAGDLRCGKLGRWLGRARAEARVRAAAIGGCLPRAQDPSQVVFVDGNTAGVASGMLGYVAEKTYCAGNR